MYRYRYLLLILLFPSLLAGQQDTIKAKSIRIDKIDDQTPQIDGDLNDPAWNKAQIISGFKQTTPKPGKNGSQPTEVKVIYDDEAIYVAARMYEASTDSIYNFLTERDWFGNADWFIVVFNTYRDGLNGEGFAVTPAGVQIDIKYSTFEEDNSWNAVWESATVIDEKGWTAELKIPYSALRFPEVEEQLWGINFGRQIRRNRETSWWNFVDPTVDGLLTQAGRAEGIKNIKPPPRLFFFPYSSAWVEHNSANDQTTTTFNAGMDIKYGLSDAFTLDITLIPDFGQTRFDNQVLNLSPFEVQFNEYRQFFTEGVELFNKADLFYSRRIGGAPLLFHEVESSIDTNERILDNPAQAQLINATKISGRNKNGLGIGFFNAVEGREEALIENLEDKSRRTIETNPLTNYNVTVIDQVLRSNSFLTLTNTNVSRNGSARDANVSQLDFKLADKNNRYALSSFAGMSHIFNESNTVSGSTWMAAFEKISGNFTFRLSQDYMSDDYNINDLGFLFINNISNSLFYGQYANYKPKANFNFWRHSFEINYQRISNPNAFANFSTSWSMVYNTTKFHAFGLNAGAEPIKTNDYFETRTFEQFYRFPRNFNFGGFISTDYSRPFAFDIRIQNRRFEEEGRRYFYYSIAPRFRPTDKLFFVIGHNRDLKRNDIGYVNPAHIGLTNRISDSIYFGRRRVIEHESFIDGSYIFNNKMALSLNLRHYWSTAVYNKFYYVDKETGALTDTDYEGFGADGVSLHNRSFNAFNIDLGFSWRFAPGSDINVVWKNIIFSSGDPLERNYYRELEQTIAAPQINSLSIKVLYFVDYLWLKKNK